MIMHIRLYTHDYSTVTSALEIFYLKSSRTSESPILLSAVSNNNWYITTTKVLLCCKSVATALC